MYNKKKRYNIPKRRNVLRWCRISYTKRSDVGDLIAGFLAVAGIIAVGLGVLSLLSSPDESKGKMIAKKERRIYEKAEYYEHSVEYSKEEKTSSDIYDLKNFNRLYRLTSDHPSKKRSELAYLE